MGEAIQEPEQAYGQRLLTSIIDDRALSNPQKSFMSIPAGYTVTDGQRDISYGDIARAINRCAWWIETTLGKRVDFLPIATYLLPMDFRHVILIFRSIKAGYKSSPRNHSDVQVALLEKLQCTLLFTPEEMSETTKIVLQKRPMQKYTLPELDYFLSQEPVEQYPYSKTFEEARKNPYVVLHSSGSTGTPKLLVLKQGSAAAHDAFQLFPSLGAAPFFVSSWVGKRVLTNFPMASTETGILPNEISPPDMWNYYRFNERLGHTFRHYADDLYELVLTRDKEKESFQFAFYTFLDADTYDMRDVYIEHPSKPGWWRSSGRIDDVVVMADAKKLNVIPYEAVIERHTGIATVLICGSGRPQPAVLLQPSQWPESGDEGRRLIDAVWPSVEKANEAGPVHGRLIKELVVLAKESKPMVRAGGKDTVMRKRSLKLYEDEIDEVYRHAEELGLLYGDFAEKGGLV